MKKFFLIIKTIVFFFFSLVLVLVASSFIPAAYEINENGEKIFKGFGVLMIVILPFVFTFIFFFLETEKISFKNAKTKLFGKIVSLKSPDLVQIDSIADPEVENLSPITPGDQKIFLTMQKLQVHREKIQEYKKSVLLKLESREKNLLAKEQALAEKETTMAQRAQEQAMQKLKEKDSELTKKEESLHRLKASIIEDRESNIAYLRELEVALRNTEYTVLDWVTRMEKRDNAVFEEMLKDAQKYQQYFFEIDGYRFEDYTAGLLKSNGYSNVKVTQKSRDYGADVLAEKDGIAYVIQCKYYTSPVGIEAVQQVYAAKGYYNAHVAVVTTNSVFTKAAKTLASELKVVLWDCEALANMAASSAEEKLLD